jgi:hypothetical protein
MKELCLFYLLTFLMSCSSVSQSILIKNDLYNYQLNVPSAWTINDNKSFVDIYPPKENSVDSSRSSLNITTFNTMGRSIDQCSGIYLGEKYMEQFDDFSLVDKGMSTVGHLKARWIEHTCRRMGDQHTFLVYLIYDESRSFLITARSKKTYFDKYQGEFERIINSFRVR